MFRKTFLYRGALPVAVATVLLSAGPGPAQAPIVSGQSALSPGTVSASSDAVAHIRVRVPAGAELWFNDTKMPPAGPLRQFRTPPLTPGKGYYYAVRALDHGRPRGLADPDGFCRPRRLHRPGLPGRRVGRYHGSQRPWGLPRSVLVRRESPEYRVAQRPSVVAAREPGRSAEGGGRTRGRCPHEASRVLERHDLRPAASGTLRGCRRRGRNAARGRAGPGPDQWPRASAERGNSRNSSLPSSRRRSNRCAGSVRYRATSQKRSLQ
jgi:uncharacterized protein (TIGR03000 family)